MVPRFSNKERQEIKDYFNKSVSIHQFNSGEVQTHKCEASHNPHGSKCSILDTAESLILEASRMHERSTVLQSHWVNTLGDHSFPTRHSLCSGSCQGTQFHMTIGCISKCFNPHTHAVMMPSSQVTIGRTSKPLDPHLFAVTMVLSQVTIGRTSKPFDPRVPIFPLIIVQPLLVG